MPSVGKTVAEKQCPGRLNDEFRVGPLKSMKTESQFYDTHAHLDYPDFANELPEVIERARSAGVTKIIAIGTDLNSSGRAVELANQYAGVFAAIGWHPSHVTEAPADVRPALRQLARNSKVVAIGETG